VQLRKDTNLMTATDISIIKDPKCWPEYPYLTLINRTTKQTATLRVVLNNSTKGYRMDLTQNVGSHLSNVIVDISPIAFMTETYKDWEIAL
jgi:hypothetical protein